MKLRGLFIAALLTLAAAQESTNTPDTGDVLLYEGLVLGIGKGTLAVIIFAIFSILICLFRDCSSMPSLLVFVAICIPILVLLIIIGLPKQTLKINGEEGENAPTDNYILWKILITVYMGLVMLVLDCVTVGMKMSIDLTAPRVSSSGETEKVATKDL